MLKETKSDSIKKLSDTANIRLSGALIVQQGQPMLITAASAQDIARQSRVDIYDPRTEKGYQRLPSDTRMREVSRYYLNGGRMPNPLLMNVREEDFGEVQVDVTNGDMKGYTVAIEEKGNWVGAGIISFPHELALWIYDGQHRKGGVVELLKKHEQFADFPVPLSITLGLSETDEMREFYMVNSNAKSVKTDLAWELLRQLSKDDPDLALELETSGKDWTSRGIEVARVLDGGDGPWADRIQAPNEKGSKSDGLTITQAQFVRSLKPILDMPLFQKAEPQVIAQVIDAYWKGIMEVLPEAFEGSPKDWVLQKGPGAIPLNRAMPRVVEVVRSRGGRLGDPAAYAAVLQPLQHLSGDVTDEETSEAKRVSGADFWRGGSKGVASAYTGDAGRKRLFIMVQALLPKPSSEIVL